MFLAATREARIAAKVGLARLTSIFENHRGEYGLWGKQMSGSFLTREQEQFALQGALDAGKRLARLLDQARNVGDLLRIDYSEAVVLVHDHMRQAVGGVPLGCFLIASRVIPGGAPNPGEEDAALVLLRVLAPAQLPNAMETEMIRFTVGQRVAQLSHTWDHPERIDQYTLHQLRYSGLRCRVLGTFMMRADEVSGQPRWSLRFGADLANFYSGSGMKVYKPDGEALRTVVNFERPYGTDRHALAGKRIRVGRVRYSASEREGDTTGLVAVEIEPTDLLARRTALFGMSRTGKSNTTKIIAASVFRLREREKGRGRVGQLIIDPNGEYANENVQDSGALRAIWNGTQHSGEDDVITYGLHPHPRDPKRRLIKLNFFGTEPRDWTDRDDVERALTPLIQGKDVIDGVLARETTNYVRAFRNASLAVPSEWDRSAQVRYRRTVTAYRAILAGAGFDAPRTIPRATLDKLTSSDLRTALANSGDYQRTAHLFSQKTVSWDEAREAFDGLRKAIQNPADSGYTGFNTKYRNSHEGRDWHDSNFTSVLALLEYRGGLRLIGQVAEQHSPLTDRDYADEIVEDLKAGRLVIVDQSTGDPEMNDAAAQRLMWRVFDSQRAAFVNPMMTPEGALVPPPDVIVYVEEAHNLLPAKETDLKNIWSRTAKEGSKYRIGLVYATQEPSSVQANILKNTDNWFVAHLNNTAEISELKDFYDFRDFSEQILAVPEPGFLRMRTLSNPYIVPVQIARFQAASG